MGDTQSTSYQITVRDGQTYYWRVKALDASLKSSDWADGPREPISIIPPDPVSNFTAQTGLQIRLNWTASGDDASVGQALAYKIQYSANGNDWLPLDSLMTVPPPAVAGTPEQLMVTGLNPGGMYSFKIQVLDHANTLSTEQDAGPALASNFQLAYSPFGNDDGIG